MKCPNGHAFDYDGCDAIKACSECRHAFCAVCSKDFGVGGDAPGNYFSRDKAIPNHAPAVQAKLIELLAGEQNMGIRTDAVTEMMHRGEYDLWRKHFDFEAIKRALNLLPEEEEESCGKESHDHCNHDSKACECADQKTVTDGNESSFNVTIPILEMWAKIAPISVQTGIASSGFITTPINVHRKTFAVTIRDAVYPIVRINECTLLKLKGTLHIFL